MKGVLGLVLFMSVLSACNDDATAGQQLDSLTKDAKVGWDSTKAEVKEIKDSLKSKFDRRDSLRRDSAKSK